MPICVHVEVRSLAARTTSSPEEEKGDAIQPRRLLVGSNRTRDPSIKGRPDSATLALQQSENELARAGATSGRWCRRRVGAWANGERDDRRPCNAFTYSVALVLIVGKPRGRLLCDVWMTVTPSRSSNAVNVDWRSLRCRKWLQLNLSFLFILDAWRSSLGLPRIST